MESLFQMFAVIPGLEYVAIRVLECAAIRTRETMAPSRGPQLRLVSADPGRLRAQLAATHPPRTRSLHSKLLQSFHCRGRTS